MADLAFSIDITELDTALREVAATLESWPAGEGNPLEEWRDGYALRTEQALSRRPSVGEGGQFRGNAWAKLEPQYTRADGTEVPVWGGVPRATIKGSEGRGAHQRLGSVTRAASSSIRLGKGLTKAQHAAGFGKVQVGQVLSGANVYGKLRKDGTRYKASDKQLYEARPGNLLGDWMQSPSILSDNGKTITVATNVPYAAAVHAKRPFAFGGDIDREETDSMRDHIVRWLQKQLDRNG